VGAVEVQQRSLTLDPLNPAVVAECGWPFQYAGLFEMALERYERAIEIDPAFGLGHYNVATARHFLGRHREALEAFQTAITLMGRVSWVLAWMALTHLAQGDMHRAEALLEEIEAQAGSGVASQLWIGMLRDALGMTEAALDALERAASSHEPFVFGLNLEGWMPFANSRQHPRFRRILRDLRLRPHDVEGQRRLLLARSR
jgi:tetratricopeptide (TPR) repeat protein